MRQLTLQLGIVLCATIGFQSVVLGHAGGLDSSGGHHDRKNGGYHYHRTTPSVPTYVRPAMPFAPRTEPRISARTSARTSARVSPPEGRIEIQGVVDDEVRYEVVSAKKFSRSTTIRVLLIFDGNVIPSNATLQAIADEVNPGSPYFAYFFLPTMDIEGLPWAIATRLNAAKHELKCFDERLPWKFSGRPPDQ